MSAGINYVLLGLRLTTIDPSFSNRAYLRAMKAFEQALEFKEPIDEDRASMVLLAAIRYDIELRSSAGADFLERMRIAYPHVMVFQLARIRHLLNSGQVLKASELCGQVFRQEPSYVFHKAEEVVGGVLATRAE